MSLSKFCFVTYLFPVWGGVNAVTTDCSKSCGRLRKVTTTISIVFFGRPWL